MLLGLCKEVLWHLNVSASELQQWNPMKNPSRVNWTMHLFLEIKQNPKDSL